MSQEHTPCEGTGHQNIYYSVPCKSYIRMFMETVRDQYKFQYYISAQPQEGHDLDNMGQNFVCARTACRDNTFRS